MAEEQNKINLEYSLYYFLDGRLKEQIYTGRYKCETHFDYSVISYLFKLNQFPELYQ